MSTPRTDALAAKLAERQGPSSLTCYPSMREHARTLELENAELRAALAELVACKDLKESIEAIRVIGPRYHELVAEYEHRKPLAWEAARAAISPSGGGRV